MIFILHTRSFSLKDWSHLARQAEVGVDYMALKRRKRPHIIPKTHTNRGQNQSRMTQICPFPDPLLLQQQSTRQRWKTSSVTEKLKTDATDICVVVLLFLVILLRGHTWQCSWLSPSSVVKDISWWGSGDYMGCP